MSDDLGELARWPPFIAEVAEEALSFATGHPRAALSQARVTVEAICGYVYRREIGEPGKLGFDEIVRQLAAKKVLTAQRELPIRTVQMWGGYGAHPIDFARIDAGFVAPCMVALQQTVAWFFMEYLQQPMPGVFSGFVVSGIRAKPAPRDDASIVVISGSAMGRRFPLVRGGSVLIGRDPKAEIALDESDLKVHREHARIEVPATGAPVLSEVTGKNPTRVNDVRVAGTVALRNGDHIQVGHTILRIELADDGT